MPLPFHLLQRNLLLKLLKWLIFFLQQQYFLGAFLILCRQTAVTVIDAPLVINIIKNSHNAKNPITAKGKDDSDLSELRMAITTHHFATNHKTKTDMKT